MAAGDRFAERIVGHLTDIGAGRCELTDEAIAAESDEQLREILIGLLYLHEELELGRRRQAEAQAALRQANDELERRVEQRTDELRKSEQQLNHAQKMEAVGRLAGGVAHDFNNVLSVILSYADLLLADLRAGDPMRADLEQIRQAGTRAADLTRQLLAFSRQQVLSPQLLDLNAVLTNLEKMLRRLLGADIELTFLPTSGLWSARADAGQIEQVLMNLAVNARDAMPRGGMLTIETHNASIDEDYAAGHAGMEPGDHVMIAVSDTGVGMDAATQARIFEPFFTTKETGRGTGLGLSTVYGIIKQSGGHVNVYSEPGHGTTFKIYLPRAIGAAVDKRSTSPAPPPSQRGSETVLLVEDDDRVRAVARGILHKNGYRVLEAQNAGEALLICEKRPNVDLLLTDVILPRQSGPELAERLRAMAPELRVLFMSGYTGEAIVHHGVLASGEPFLQKPFTPETLARKVREALSLPRRR